MLTIIKKKFIKDFYITYYEVFLSLVLLFKDIINIFVRATNTKICRSQIAVQWTIALNY